MARVLLIHGAWHGAWTWDPVLGALRDAGHDVDAIDLPGSDGDLRVTLRDQADAVASRLAESRSILVAHSHGGLVAQDATALVPGQVSGVVGVDAWFAPGPGTFLGVIPDWMSELIQASVERDEGESFVPVPPPAMFGIDDPELAARMEALLVRQPHGTFTGPATGFSFRQAGIPGVAIVCEPRSLPFDALGAVQGFDVWPITSGHDAPLLRPTELAVMLNRAITSIGERATRTHS